MSYDDALLAAVVVLTLCNAFSWHALLKVLQFRDQHIRRLTRRVWILEGSPDHECGAAERDA